MASITTIANEFFVACETGKGWEGCKAYCAPNATFANNVAAYAIFSGTHTGLGGPCEPTGKKTASDYVYVMQFNGDKISHMTKIWHSGLALKELGWA
jgi:hypothetical protein